MEGIDQGKSVDPTGGQLHMRCLYLLVREQRDEGIPARITNSYTVDICCHPCDAVPHSWVSGWVFVGVLQISACWQLHCCSLAPDSLLHALPATPAWLGRLPPPTMRSGWRTHWAGRAGVQLLTGLLPLAECHILSIAPLL